MISYFLQRKVRVIGAVALVSTLLTSCFSSTKKLDETIFFDGSGFKLKLVRYYEDYPWHFSGEISVIHCATDQTRNMRTYSRTQENGWAEIERIRALGSKSSAEVLERAQLRPRVIDEYILTIIGANRFLATFDGCQTFMSWHASQDDLLVQQSKPEYCQHDATRLCPDVTPFEGDRQLQFLNLRFDPQSGSISFLVKSKAFKDEGTFSVSSQDKGKTWTTTALK